MIHLSCNNCCNALFGKAVIRVDSGSVDMTCPRCKAVYRVSITLLRAGAVQDPVEKSHKLAHTYDAEHNRIPLVPLKPDNKVHDGTPDTARDAEDAYNVFG
jgi:phage FluMu protein Com